jgi:uncharacterized protein (TIGR02145 family)
VVTERPLPTELSLTSVSICKTQSAILTASAVDSTSTLAYRIDGGASWTPAADNAYFTGISDCAKGEQWQTSATFSVTPTATQSYPLYVRTAEGCSATLAEAATVTVLSPLPFIFQQPDSKAVCHNTTARLYVLASPATAAYQWYKNGVKVTSEGSGYTTANYTTGSVTTPATYSVVVTNADCPVTAMSDEAVVSITIDGCPVGNEDCTPPEGTASFSAFAPCSNAPVGTKWYLTDERDSKVYRTVKMPDNRVWMAQNLNYQTGLTWQPNSASPSTTSSGTALIGSFWCPGNNGATVSTEAGCNTWGALYSWETAMSFNGVDNWTEVVTSYSTGKANTTGAKVNYGRKTSGSNDIGGSGICPAEWHVPTDFEWAVLLDNMESAGGTRHQTTDPSQAVNFWFGEDAGGRAKSKATCLPTTVTCATEVSTSWDYKAGTTGEDTYGFNALPAGFRRSNGAAFGRLGEQGVFWSSSANDAILAVNRQFYAENSAVRRTFDLRFYGFSVRCVKD